MLNICIVIPQFFPVPAVKGGAVEQLATFLADENEKFHKVNLTFCSIEDDEAIEVSKKYRYSNFEYIPLYLKDEAFDYAAVDNIFDEYMEKVEKVIQKNNFDYVILMGGKKEHAISSVPIEKRISYLHGPEIEKGLENYYSYIMVVSHFIANCYYTQTDTPKERVIPLENAIHVSDFARKLDEKEKQKLKEKYSIRNDDIIINFCGRTIKEKGIKELIMAFKKMKNLDKCKLLVSGNCNYGKQVKTPFEAELAELAKGMEDKIIFTGFIPNKELYKIHNISDIAVIPSVFEEPFGLTVIEAMASSLPLVTSDAGAIPDIVDNKNAIIAKRGEHYVDNLANALDVLVENESLRKQMGEHSYNLVKNYDTPNYYNNFCKILYEIDSKK